MYKFIFMFLLALSLEASNPKPYAVLGDVIYNTAVNIEKLRAMKLCKINKNGIAEYINEVDEARQYGFDLEEKKENREKKAYLNKLRKLSKMNDQYLRDIKNAYKRSMKNNKYLLFSGIINSGLIDADANKDEIIDYYYKHSDDIKRDGVIEKFLDEDAKLEAQKEALKRSYKTKKELELEKIKRIRENDKRAKSKLEEELQDSLNKKKLEIRTNQEKELAN